MGRWLEHTVTTDVRAPVSRVWAVWSDLEAMPHWMRWIESVQTLDDPDLTDWTLAAQGFRFRWKARITTRVEAQQLHWESVGGLPTKGAVRFYPEADDRTAVKLSVTYELPGVLAPSWNRASWEGWLPRNSRRTLTDSVIWWKAITPCRPDQWRPAQLSRQVLIVLLTLLAGCASPDPEESLVDPSSPLGSPAVTPEENQIAAIPSVPPPR